jgi:hypothetical protein
MLGNRLAPTPRFAMAPEGEGGTTHKVSRPDSAGGNVAQIGGVQSGAATETPPAVTGRPQDPGSETLSSSAAETANDTARPQGAASSPASSRNAFANTWRNDMAAGDKAFLKMLDRFDSPASLAKAYKELTAKLSSGELKAMKPPGDNATPEQVATWRSDHGLPENAAAYVRGLRLGDGTVTGAAEEPLLSSFAEQAMKSNWTGEQFNQAVGWYFATQDLLLAQRQDADAEFKEKSSSDLRRDWGSDYAINRNMVAQFLDRNFPQQFKIDLLNARLPNGRLLGNDQAFSKAVLELAKLVNPAGPLLPNASGAGLADVESRIAEIEAKYMRAAHGSESWRTYWSGESGAKMQQEYRGLLAAREQTRRGRAG